MDYKKLNALINSIEELKLLASGMYQIAADDDFRNSYYILALSTERLAVRAREAVTQDTGISKQEYLNAAATEMNIRVEPVDGGVRFILPYLLQKRKSIRSESFIIEPLAYVLKEYVAENNPEKIREASIEICSFYTTDNKKIIRDTDNIELRRILNIISSALLVDDNMVDLHILNRVGDSVHTEITVCDRSKRQICE